MVSIWTSLIIYCLVKGQVLKEDRIRPSVLKQYAICEYVKEQYVKEQYVKEQYVKEM